MIGFTNLLPALMKKDLVTDFLTTVKGKPLDATMGKQLKDEVNEINSDLAKGQIEFDIQSGKGVWRKKGADTWSPFRHLQKFYGNFTWNSSGKQNITINISSLQSYDKLTTQDMISAINYARAFVTNTGANADISCSVTAYDAKTGNVTVTISYTTWCINTITGSVVLIVAA